MSLYLRPILALLLGSLTFALMTSLGAAVLTASLATVVVWVCSLLIELQVDRIIDALGKDK